MIIDPETGSVLSKKDTTNKRHLWEQTGPLIYTCQKCPCEKHKLDQKLYIYIVDNVRYDHAPECTNTKIEIIKNEKNDNKKAKTNEGTQLELF